MFSMKFDTKERSRLTGPLQNRSAEIESCSTDLDTLHSKLQLEADKFVRWKVSTEVKLHQKERQLQGSQETVKILKDNLLQLQLTKETLTQSLQRERKNKELIDAKVSTTRQLVQNVQQQHDQVMLSVQQFSDVRHTLSTNQEQNLCDITNLCTEFQQLELTVSEFMKNTFNNAKKELSAISSEKRNIEQNLTREEELKEQLLVQIEKKNDELKSYLDEVLALQFQIESNEVELDNLRQSKSSLNKELQNWQQSVEKLEKREEEFKRDANVKDKELSTLEETKNDLEERLRESQAEFIETAEKISFLKRCNETLEGTKGELIQQVETLSLKNEQVEEDLKITSEQLTEIRFVSKANENLLMGQAVNLEKVSAELRSTIINYEEENQRKNDDFKKEKEQLLMENNSKIGALTYEMDELKINISNYTSEHELTLDENKSLELKSKENEDKLEELTKELNIANLEVKKHEELGEKMTNKIEERGNQNEKLDKELEIMRLEQNTMKCELTAAQKSLVIEKEEKNSKNSICEKQFDEIETLQKTINELENEIKSKKKTMSVDGKKASVNKRKLDSIEKSLSIYKEKLTKEKQALSVMKEEKKQQIDDEKKINSELLSTCNAKNQEAIELKAEIKDMEQLKDQAFAEAAKHKELCIHLQLESESKIKEMVNLLDQYKQENEKNLRSKDVEITVLQNKLEEIKDSVHKTISGKLSTDRVQDISPKDQLKTPSPSVYLSLCRPISAMRSQIPPKKHTSMMPSNNDHFPQHCLKLKTVSFKSPLHYPYDEDSSDINALEVVSDMDDSFDALRKIDKRCTRQIRANLPQAKVQPLSSNRQDNIRKTPKKKPRLDKENMKTYSSPGSMKKDVENKVLLVSNKDDDNDKSKVSFQNIFQFN